GQFKLPKMLAPAVGAAVAFAGFSYPSFVGALKERTGNLFSAYLLDEAWGFAVPLIIAGFIFSGTRPFRFSAPAILVAALVNFERGDTSLYRSRNFFGCLDVRVKEKEHAVILYNGITIHGKQSLDPQRKSEPLSYYHRQSPIGEVLTCLF